MKDFKKILLIYMVMIFMFYILCRGIDIFKLNQVITTGIEVISMILLFRIFNVNKKYVLVFLSILTIFMTILAIDAESIVGKYEMVGFYMENAFFPYELIVLSIFITFPLSGVLVILRDYNLVSMAYYLVPLFMFLIIIVSLLVLRIGKKCDTRLT
ncbi:hypothetical protein [uncultured Clostridium sp.]|uniref:hypothetical protein n=1 Tax=uncultured Clostridium sp. TaxID=59620 RepID=UPI0025DAE6D0|nr:hypothetical protein [uncultured Clostridium sp.]